MLTIIDNYDSFTYNVFHYFGELGATAQVFRNDKINVDEVFSLNPEGIIISPGPCGPEKAGISINIVKKAAEKKMDTPVLGICLGHQTIGAAFGAKIIRANNIMHGKIDKIIHQENSEIFKDIPPSFEATRYHSLIIKEDTIPSTLSITARSSDNSIMGIKHKHYPIFGVQFHPESIKTTNGKKILSNFLRIIDNNGKRKNR